jgi:predicted negative regulator of RcsB-dependent stress response
MAVYDLEEQEQIDELKVWWQTHGNLITWVVVAVSVGVITWQGWNWYQNKQSAEASLIFGALQQANQMHDNSRVKNLAGELTEKYSSTTYAHLAALVAARASIGADDTKTAKAQLQWASDHASDEIRALARIRLAGLLLDEKAFDEALKTLADEKLPAFAAQVSALKGDVYLAQGKRKEAKDAYTAALAASKSQKEVDADRPSAWSQLLQQKLDSLGDAT